MSPLRRLVAAGALLLAACGGGGGGPLPSIGGPETITLQSAAFPEGGSIPATFTCDGADQSPPLSWSAGPQAAEYALLMTDLDAPGGTFVHWAVFGIRGDARGTVQGRPPERAREAQNDFGDVGYGGPCPPADDPPHRYVFTIYALRSHATGGLPSGTPARDVLAKIECCVVARGELTATFDRTA
jgi:Raf kinase inhibitor-like YbhB/YbcL family protein